MRIRSRSRIALVALAAVSVAAVVVGATAADELPPPAGWPQEVWDELSSEDQELERDMSAPRVDDVDAAIAEAEAWLESHPPETLLDEFAQELEAEGEGSSTLQLGRSEAQQDFAKDLWSFEQRWIELDATETQVIQTYAGSLANDSSRGVILVRALSTTESRILAEDVYEYPDSGGGFRIEGARDRNLVLSRWTLGERQPGTVLFDLDSRTFAEGYEFTGFFSPVDNQPTLNSVNAGRAIPVKFSLGGDRGLDIFEAGYPKVLSIDCSTSAPLDEVEQTTTAGGSSLGYDATSDRYTYVWKTDSVWAGTCRRLVLGLDDGTQRSADFKFR